MKKIGILTFHNACNYGAFLQAMSLCNTINEYDDTDACLIDYHCKAIEDHYSIRGIFKTKGIKKFILKILRLPSIIKRNRLFKEARQKNFRLAPFDNDTFKDYYRFVAGSDQIWNLNLTSNDKSYFLDFAQGSQKTSYAGSLGKIKSVEQIHHLVELLKDFHAVAVREKMLYDAVKNENCNNLTVTIDPVFLTSKEKWLDFAGKEPIISEKYIIIFIMGVTKQGDYLVKLGKKLANEKKCRLIVFGDQERWYKYRDIEHFGVASPSQFVNLIANAEIVLTNSFHATSFSIIMQSDFLSECNIGSPERVTSLLEIAGLSSHRIYDGEYKYGEPESIEWNDVQRRIDNEVKKSKEYIEKYIVN